MNLNKKNEYVNEIRNKLCMDSSREEFARDTFQSLFFLTQGSYENKNGYKRLLLGRKGVGKTFF